MDVGRISSVTSLVLEADEPNGPDFPAWSPELARDRLSLAKGAPLIVDISRVRRAKSDLFGYLARLKGLMAEQGSVVVLLMGDPALGRTVELLGLDRVFRLTWSSHEALQACGVDGEALRAS